MYIISLIITNGVKVYLSITDIHGIYEIVLVFQRSYAEEYLSRDAANDEIKSLPENLRKLNWQIEAI